jgi:hypothetical protein
MFLLALPSLNVGCRQDNPNKEIASSWVKTMRENSVSFGKLVVASSLFHETLVRGAIK